MKIKITNQIQVTGTPRNLDREIRKRLTLKNPEYLQAKKMGRYLWNIDEYLFFFKKDDTGSLFLPRGYARELFTLCREQGVKPEFVDNRRILSEVSFSFEGTLRDYQEDAFDDILKRDFGNLDSAVGSGKTIMCLATIAARRQPTTVVVHSKELLFQWRERVTEFLNIPESEIGIIGAGEKTIGTRLTIGIKNSVLNCLDEITPRTGFLVVDEAHRAGSKGYCDLIGGFDCQYMLGVSGTPFRSDGLSKVIRWNLGPVVHKVPQKALVNAGHILNPEIVWRPTRFTTELNPSEEYSRVISEVVSNSERNKQIIQDVQEAINTDGQTCLLLSDRKQHCETLKSLLGADAVVVIGTTSTKGRKQALDAVREGAAKVLIATNSLIGEGFDMARLSNLFLCSPVKWRGRTIQMIGRILRPLEGKSAKLYDYVDSGVGVLKAQGKARLKTYQEQGWC
ncbi:MAG: DEAD/DEAH box helicase [Deltaproteobacteria bacterium]|nr:DEAD/DEAH box helicase [Deltaproteobacteria bacterium]